MTKMKSKKMTKSTFAVIIMAVLMVAMMAFGGTYAYFTATTAKVTETATTGRVQLTENSAYELNAIVVPGQELLAEDKTVSVVSNSTVKTYVFVKFSATFAKGTEGTYVDGEPALKANKEACTAEGNYCITPSLNLYDADENPTGWKTYVDNKGNEDPTDDITVYYVELEPAVDEETDEFTSSTLEVCDSILFEGKSQSNGASKGVLMDGTLTVTISSASIQFDYVDDVADAYAEVKATLLA